MCEKPCHTVGVHCFTPFDKSTQSSIILLFTKFLDHILARVVSWAEKTFADWESFFWLP
jgi:hypothetical protein